MVSLRPVTLPFMYAISHSESNAETRFEFPGDLVSTRSGWLTFSVLGSIRITQSAPAVPRCMPFGFPRC